jgi:UDP-GlcNAc3NAcA epimerase
VKIVTVIGARPQFIKAVCVSRAVAEHADVEELIVHTGQHFDANMSDIFFDQLGIPQPAYHLGIGGGTHGQNSGRMIEAIERVLLDERPDWLLVYGDTDSTLAGAVAAAKLHISVAHVEAGLRSFNMRMPEEINRRLTDHVSTLLFAPTDAAVTNLAAEGIAGDRVRQVGDVMFDAARLFGASVGEAATLLGRLGVSSKEYILATVHRQENADDPDRLRAIVEALGTAVLPVVLPLHPRTRARLAQMEISLPSRIVAVDPLGYLDMTALQRHAAFVVTDSGGVQKEAFFHGVPCVTLRDETEWGELITLGWNRLARPGRDDLVAALAQVPPLGQAGVAPYGDGHTAQRIVAALAA